MVFYLGLLASPSSISPTTLQKREKSSELHESHYTARLGQGGHVPPMPTRGYANALNLSTDVGWGFLDAHLCKRNVRLFLVSVIKLLSFFYHKCYAQNCTRTKPWELMTMDDRPWPWLQGQNFWLWTCSWSPRPWPCPAQGLGQGLGLGRELES